METYEQSHVRYHHDQGSVVEDLPLGCSFDPDDGELIVNFLIKKIKNEAMSCNTIKDVNVYSHSPEILTVAYNLPLGQKKWYFFTARCRKTQNASRPSRVTEDHSGFWKSTSGDKVVKYNDEVVGSKNTLVFYEGKSGNGNKTNWIMHEYKILKRDDVKFDELVLCSIYNRDATSSRNRQETAMGAYAQFEQQNRYVTSENAIQRATNELQFSNQRIPIDNLPSGCCFAPTNVQLISFLDKKVKKEWMPENRIQEVNIYGDCPQILTETYPPLGKRKWYFFTPRYQKYQSGSRPSRLVGNTGYWKATSGEKPVIKQNGETVGLKLALVYYEVKLGKGVKTNWIMHEFKLKRRDGVKFDELVVCSIYNRDVKSSRKQEDTSPVSVLDGMSIVEEGMTTEDIETWDRINQSDVADIMEEFFCVDNAEGTSGDNNETAPWEENQDQEIEVPTNFSNGSAIFSLLDNMDFNVEGIPSEAVEESFRALESLLHSDYVPEVPRPLFIDTPAANTLENDTTSTSNEVCSNKEQEDEESFRALESLLHSDYVPEVPRPLFIDTPAANTLENDTTSTSNEVCSNKEQEDEVPMDFSNFPEVPEYVIDQLNGGAFPEVPENLEDFINEDVMDDEDNFE